MIIKFVPYINNIKCNEVWYFMTKNRIPPINTGNPAFTDNKFDGELICIFVISLNENIFTFSSCIVGALFCKNPDTFWRRIRITNQESQDYNRLLSYILLNLRIFLILIRVTSRNKVQKLLTKWFSCDTILEIGSTNYLIFYKFCASWSIILHDFFLSFFTISNFFLSLIPPSTALTIKE